jgi:hypothetical protein
MPRLILILIIKQKVPLLLKNTKISLQKKNNAHSKTTTYECVVVKQTFVFTIFVQCL